MPTQGPNWEGLILAFAMIFTVLLGVFYGVAMLFRTPVPWLVALVLSLALTFGLGYLRSRPRA